MKRVLVIHGPNLNLLGEREPEIYGRETLISLNRRLDDEAPGLGMRLEHFQSNHEGSLIDRLQEARAGMDGILLNPGGLTHTSVALRDAVAALRIPVVEVHLSNLFAREPFRQRDLIAPVCTGIVMGMGVAGYFAALRGLKDLMAAPAVPPADGTGGSDHAS